MLSDRAVSRRRWSTRGSAGARMHTWLDVGRKWKRGSEPSLMVRAEVQHRGWSRACNGDSDGSELPGVLRVCRSREVLAVARS